LAKSSSKTIYIPAYHSVLFPALKYADWLQLRVEGAAVGRLGERWLIARGKQVVEGVVGTS